MCGNGLEGSGGQIPDRWKKLNMGQSVFLGPENSSCFTASSHKAWPVFLFCLSRARCASQTLQDVEPGPRLRLGGGRHPPTSFLPGTKLLFANKEEKTGPVSQEFLKHINEQLMSKNSFISHSFIQSVSQSTSIENQLCTEPGLGRQCG